MSDMDVKKAQIEAEQSRIEFELAMDHLREKIEEEAGIFDELQDKVIQMKDRATHVAEDPRKYVKSYIDDSVKTAEEYVDKFAETGKEKVHKLVDQTRTEAENAVRQAVDLSRQATDQVVDQIRNAANEALSIMEQGRFASWMSVFFMGCVVGMVYARRFMARQMPASTRPEPMETPRTEEQQQPQAKAAA